MQYSLLLSTVVDRVGRAGFSVVKHDSRKAKLRRTRWEFQGNRAPALEFTQRPLYVADNSKCRHSSDVDEGEDRKITPSAVIEEICCARQDFCLLPPSVFMPPALAIFDYLICFCFELKNSEVPCCGSVSPCIWNRVEMHVRLVLCVSPVLS
jgi:hypothetical protein